MSVRVSVIINPISGTGGRRDVVRERLRLAQSLGTTHGVEVRTAVTERQGHARELAEAALADGITTVLAWGGDGTLNEIGSVLAFRDASLGIVPSGSGNGLARELGIPMDPGAAFAIALGGSERTIDCGELDGHLFFNVAGLGLDARVAHEFSAHGLTRRGFRRYLEVTIRELFRYTPDVHTIDVGGQSIRARTLMIVIANGCQYGNGARIAPHAKLDDGQLDVVVVGERPVWRALMQIPRVFTGQIARVPGVTLLRGTTIQITSGRPALFHVDGEPFVGGASLRAKTHPRALRIRVPERGA